MTSGLDGDPDPANGVVLDRRDNPDLATLTGVELSPQFQLVSLQPSSSKQPFSSKGKHMPLPICSTTLGSSW